MLNIKRGEISAIMRYILYVTRDKKIALEIQLIHEMVKYYESNVRKKHYSEIKTSRKKRFYLDLSDKNRVVWLLQNAGVCRL